MTVQAPAASPDGIGSAAVVEPESPTAAAVVEPESPTAAAVVEPESPTAAAVVEPESPTAAAVVEPPDGAENAAVGASEAPERAVALDMVRRSVFFAVPLLVAGTLGWQWAGLWSVGLALGLVLVNFMLGAAAIGWGARIGPNAMMAAVLGGYILRLGIVAAAVLPFVRHDWFELLPFAVSLLVTHLGLLVVESRHVAMSAAFPGLKPGREFPPRRGSARPSSAAESSAAGPSAMEPSP